MKIEKLIEETYDMSNIFSVNIVVVVDNYLVSDIDDRYWSLWEGYKPFYNINIYDYIKDRFDITQTLAGNLLEVESPDEFIEFVDVVGTINNAIDEVTAELREGFEEGELIEPDDGFEHDSFEIEIYNRYNDRIISDMTKYSKGN